MSPRRPAETLRVAPGERRSLGRQLLLWSLLVSLAVGVLTLPLYLALLGQLRGAALREDLRQVQGWWSAWAENAEGEAGAARAWCAHGQALWPHVLVIQRAGDRPLCGTAPTDVASRRREVLSERYDVEVSRAPWVALAATLHRAVFFYLALALVLAGVWVLRRIRREVFVPLERLERATTSVEQGHYGQALEVLPQRAVAEVQAFVDAFRAMAEALRDKEQELSSKVAALERANAQLAEAQEALVQAERRSTLGTMAAGIAHEVGNPLAAVMGMLQVVLRGRQDGERQRELLERSVEELERMRRLLRGLLDLARDDAADASTWVALAPVVERTRALWEHDPRAGGVRVSVEGLRPELVVRAQEEKLSQLLLNLFLNAADALRSSESSDGVVRLSVEEGGLGDGEGWSLVIEDSGPGMTAAVLARAAQPFFTTKGAGQGTGLGLSICEGLMRSWGGALRVASVPGEGTRVTLYWPSSSSSLTPPGAGRSASGGSPSGK